jgi:hypothetical protein
MRKQEEIYKKSKLYASGGKRQQKRKFISIFPRLREGINKVFETGNDNGEETVADF